MFKYYALLIVYRLLGWLPTRAAYFIAGLVATLSYYLRGNLRRTFRQNLRQIMGPDADDKAVRATARRAVRNLVYYYADLLLVPHLNVRKFFDNNLTPYNLERFLDATKTGRGLLVVSAHYGNPELVLQAAGALGVQAFGVTEPLQPRQLSDFIHRLRATHGQVFKPVSLSTIKEAIRWLNEGKAVSLLCDRDIQNTGIILPFCGRETRMPVGAAQLAMRTNALVLPMFSRRTHGNHFEVYTEPLLEMERTGDNDRDVRVNTQRILEVVERFLRLDPGQWLVTEPVWDGGETAAPADSPLAGHQV